MLTAHAGLAIRQPCSITWDIVVNRQQKLSNSSPHIVNCVICNDHTIIDWMLLKFTQVSQQNCRQPGRKFEKSFCAVDRLSCQLELSKSETSQFRSDLVFDIVYYVHVIFLHGGLMLFWDIWRVSSDFSVANFLCQNRPDVGNIIPINYQITARLFHILQHMPCD